MVLGSVLQQAHQWRSSPRIRWIRNHFGSNNDKTVPTPAPVPAPTPAPTHCSNGRAPGVGCPLFAGSPRTGGHGLRRDEHLGAGRALHPFGHIGLDSGSADFATADSGTADSRTADSGTAAAGDDSDTKPVFNRVPADKTVARTPAATTPAATSGTAARKAISP